MNEHNLREQVAAATSYEELFVPALFKQWAPLVINSANVQSGHRILDVACGTGILAREAASRVGPSGYTAGLDIAAGMLEVARRIAPAIDWKQGPAEALPFPDRSFDAVVSQFGLMFFPDREKSMREMLRVLVLGGRLSVAVFDSLSNLSAYADEVALLERSAGKKAADALRAPFVLGQKDGLTQLARKVGINALEVTTHKGTARFPSIRTLVEADLRVWLPVMAVILDEEKIQQILADAEQALSAYVDEHGQAVFSVSAHIISGSKSKLF